MANQQQEKEPKFKIRTGLIYQEDLESLGKTIDDVVEYYTQITEQIYKGMYILISPLHTLDDDKKPHYHVYMENKSELPEADYNKLILQFRTIKELTTKNGNKRRITELVKSGKQMRRYLLHLDNPEKEQFEGGACDLYYISIQRSQIEHELQNTDDISIINMVYDYLAIDGAKNSMREFIQYCKVSYEINIYKEVIKYCASHSYFITQILKG